VNRTRYNGSNLLSLSLAAIGLGVVLTALQWPISTALFPIVVGSLVFIASMVELLLSLLEGGEAGNPNAVEAGSSGDIDKPLAARRTLLIWGWIMCFFLMILLLGFLIAVPLFVFLYSKIYGREKWGTSIILAGSCWVFFYGLFVRLLNTSLQDGWLFMWLGFI
jgi:hypothetical protein